MEKMNKNDFIDVYVLKTLNEIKNTVKRNIKLDNERVEEIDKKMTLVLKDLINANFKNLQMDPNGNLIYTFLPIIDEQENEKVRLSLVLYYTALYYDNVDLLHDLLRENINFNNGRNINLQYLDKTISSKFERKKYIEIIKNCGYIFRNFVNSIKNLSEEEREKYIRRFTKLINLKYKLICKTLKIKTDYYWSGERFDSIFNKNNLDTFTDETYIKSTEKQLDFINSCKSESYKKETCERLNHLMQTKDFSNHLCNFDLMMELYTDDQLETLDHSISYAIDKFSKTEESFNKIVDFIQRRPDLARRITELSIEEFLEIDNFTLIEMCDNFKFISPIYNNINLMAKSIKPMVVLKKILGFYKKDKTKTENGPVLIKK